MNLEHLSLAVRERSLPEVYDLALLLARRHAPRLALVAALGAAPWIMLDLLLLRWTDPASPLPVWMWIALLCAEAPLATAPITAFLGEAMFAPRPRVRSALAAAWRRTGALLWFAAGRWICGLLPPLLVLCPPHAVEVLLLERQPLRAARVRCRALAADWRGEWLLHLLVAASLLTAWVVVALFAGDHLLAVLRLNDHEWWQPFTRLLPQHPLALLLPWPALAFLAVVRFLAYLDLRTRREGWEVELGLRRAGRRVATVAA